MKAKTLFAVGSTAMVMALIACSGCGSDLQPSFHARWMSRLRSTRSGETHKYTRPSHVATTEATQGKLIEYAIFPKYRVGGIIVIQ
jgi:hypothetical protein